MKIAVVGSREFKDEKFISDILLNPELNNTGILVSGGAKGVDTWAEEIWDNMGWEKIIFKPNWNKYGKKAGFLRNQQIVDVADKLIAFWNGKSKGTKHSIDLAVKKGIPVDIYIRN